MKRRFLPTLLSIVVFEFSNAVYAFAGCGNEQLACGQEERCCEHTVASFTNDGVSTPTYMEGKCIPKEQSCSDFWCGNRHCEGGFFGTPTVCYVNNTLGTL